MSNEVLCTLLLYCSPLTPVDHPNLLPAGCIQEPTFCQLVGIGDSAPLHFTCMLYPEAQQCDDVLESSPTSCRLVLPQWPRALFRKTGECSGVCADRVCLGRCL